MANTTFNVPRAHLIMGLCLPLAVLLGYFVAEPMDSGNMAVIVVVLGVLLVPIMMRWYHPLLVLSWNAAMGFQFLPGRPQLWMFMAFCGLLFAVLNRSVNPTRRFLFVPSITKSIVLLGGIVVLTAVMTGGIGFRVMGSDRYGGKNYLFIFAALAGYFALTSQRIALHRAPLFIGIFFLSGLTSLATYAAYAGGPAFYFMFGLFPPDPAMEEATAVTTQTIGRIGGLSIASTCVYGYLLARYGIRGVFDFHKPWRLAILGLAFAGCVASGYRSVPLLFVVTFACAFYFEGLFRTRLLPVLCGLGILAAVVAIPFSDSLPLVAQRSIAFLPVKVDPLVRDSADTSTKWRVEMWKMLLPQVPRYLLKGKGYAMDSGDLFLVQHSMARGFQANSAGAAFAGDYHNGPLSVIIPFGIWGVAAFGWFLVATLRYLLHNHRFGDPSLSSVNTFLLSLFVAKTVFFLLVFGSFFSDLATFVGIIGLSVSINGEVTVPEPEPAEELLNSYSQPV